MTTNSTDLSKQINFLVYSTLEEDIKVNAILKDETIWLSQKGMAELFECSTDNIGLHLKNIYESGELIQNRTTDEFSVVQKEGSRNVNRTIAFYNLDAIISVDKF